MESQKVKLCYSVKEAARLTGVGVNSMYSLIHSRGFPAVWLSPRRCVIPCDLFREWLSKQASITAGGGVRRAVE